MPILTGAAIYTAVDHYKKKRAREAAEREANAEPEAIETSIKPDIDDIDNPNSLDRDTKLKQALSSDPAHSDFSPSTPTMSDYPADDKASIYSTTSTVATGSVVPTTPPPEYEDVTPRGSLQEDREDRDIDLAFVPGLEGLPAFITSASKTQPRSYFDLPGPSSSSPPKTWNNYRIPHSSLSKDRTTVTTSDPILLSNADALTAFIHAQCALPPVPEIRIVGTHSRGDSYTSSSATDAVDFDIRLKLLRYFISPQVHSQYAPSMTNYIRVSLPDGTTRALPPAPSDSSPESNNTTTPSSHISHLAHSFVSDPTTNKSLTLTRTPINWDKAHLKGSILSLLSDLRYRGDVSITFPVSHAKVVIQPERTVADSFKSLFYEKKVYEGIDAVWPYANVPPPSAGKGGAEGGASTNPARTFAVRSEQGWWHDWKGAVERAVLEGRKGAVGVDDLLEIRLGFPGPGRRWKDWGTSGW